MERNATDSGASVAVPTMSDLTTWSEMTETTEATSSMSKWVELREKCEPLLIIARNTTPFRTESEERNFCKSVLHFMNALRIKENEGDLLHAATVCTDLTNPVTRRFLGEATNEFAVEVLEAMVEMFDAKIQCHGPHSKLLKEISMRVKVLQRMREYLEGIFGKVNEGHQFVDEFRLAKIRSGIRTWEDLIQNCYTVLRAMRTPVEAISTVYKIEQREDKDEVYGALHYKNILKQACVDISIIIDNFKIPEGWSKSQVFQLAADVLIQKSKDYIEVERVFDSKSRLAGHSIKTAIRMCICFKSTYECVLEMNRKTLAISDPELTSEKLFGPMSAFISRCKDLLEISYTNAQFLSGKMGNSTAATASSNAFKNTGGATMGSEEIRSVAAKYQSLIGNIKASGRKCLDVENEQLRNDFQTFKRQVHELDQSLLEALKMSFDDVKNVKEACDVLDTFFSVSERTRIRDLYNLCKEKILQQLVESTIRQKNTIHRRLRYLNKFYSNMTVELLRFKGLMVKERTLREDVLGSRFFQDVSMENAMRTQSIMTAKEEHDLKTVFAKIVSSRLDEPITGVNNANQFVISRSPNYEGMMDVNFKRSVISTFMEATCLEENVVLITATTNRNRESLRNRQRSQMIEVCNLCRLVSDYNMLMGKLSQQEKGLFRNRLIQLERRMWSGIYKITWQNLASLKSWIEMCNETVLQQLKGVEEYKTVNKAINSILAEIEERRIPFLDVEEGDPDKFLAFSSSLVRKHIGFCVQKTKNLTNYVLKLESFLEVADDRGEKPGIWKEYVICIERKLAAAYEKSLTSSLRFLISLISGFRAREACFV